MAASRHIANRKFYTIHRCDARGLDLESTKMKLREFGNGSFEIRDGVLLAMGNHLAM